ncbi:MAG: CaiB/BaiF CoA-transferase family protein [Dehalococcoidia bacterium]|nr:CaiB/BaiF CoA-transferase family protein [Dehalococcoidia bacterium]
MMNKGALEGYRVIDLCRAGPGQLATGVLADYGADVITIVEPGYAQRRQVGGSTAKGFGQVNRRNKRGLFLNMKAEGALDIFMKLVSRSDAIVESNRPGVAKRLGVDYDAVRKANSAIVYVSLSGYGQYGPYADIPGHDLSFQGVGGMIPQDERGRPHHPTYNHADMNAAWYGAFALFIGLLHKARTGRGQYIDVAFSDASISLPAGHLEDEMLCGAYPCHNIYECKDGKHLTLSTREPWFWERLLKVLGREDWLPHQRPQGKLKEEMFAFFRKSFKSKPRHEWLKILKGADCQFGSVNLTAEDLRDDPHNKAREMVIETQNPATGDKMFIPGFALKLSNTPAKMWRGPSLMGLDTEDVLIELGYSHEDISRFRQSEAIG